MSKADRKPAANLLQTWWFLQSRVWRDLETRPLFGNMEDTDAIVIACIVGLLRSLCEVYRCRDDVSGQEETETQSMG